MLTACGGGGGGNSNTPVPPTPAAPTAIELLDSNPIADTTNTAHYRAGFSLSHAGQSGASYDLNITCAGGSGFTIERESIDIASATMLLEHRFTCPDRLDANTSYEMTVNTTISDEVFEGKATFTTGASNADLNVLAETQTSREDLESLFANYIEGGLVDELDLPPLLEQVLISVIVDLASSEWQNLAHPEVVHGATVQRVGYASISPDGEESANLSGLIAFPDNPDAANRDQVILLNHATGSTPSDFNTSDAWYIIAQLFAGRGYLVIALDNYGRGSTGDSPESYLLAGRTGANAVDLVQRVLADETYDRYYDNAVSPVSIIIIGYSQGGHSAMASWLEIVRHHDDSLTVDAVFAELTAGDVFGEVGYIQEIERTADVIATAPVAALNFDYNRMAKDLKFFPHIVAKLNFNISSILGTRLADVLAQR